MSNPNAVKDLSEKIDRLQETVDRLQKHVDRLELKVNDGNNKADRQYLFSRKKFAYQEKLILSEKLAAQDFVNHYDFPGFGLVSFQDTKVSSTTDFIVHEVFGVNETGRKDDPYFFGDIPFEEGDVVIDIGANIGIVSVYLALRFPFLRIHAYEPVQRNYRNLVANLEANGVSDRVRAHPLGVSGDGKPIDLLFFPDAPGNSRSEAALEDPDYAGGVKRLIQRETAETTTLPEILSGIEGNIRLLKIDCEGAEKQIFEQTPGEHLQRIQHLRGELHYGKGNETLIEGLSQHVARENLRFTLM